MSSANERPVGQAQRLVRRQTYKVELPVLVIQHYEVDATSAAEALSLVNSHDEAVQFVDSQPSRTLRARNAKPVLPNEG